VTEWWADRGGVPSAALPSHTPAPAATPTGPPPATAAPAGGAGGAASETGGHDTVVAGEVTAPTPAPSPDDSSPPADAAATLTPHAAAEHAVAGGCAASDAEWRVQIAVHAFSGDGAQLDALLAAGMHIIVDGAVCDPSEEGVALRAVAARIPLSRLLLTSNAPLHTPQNIADHMVRTTRNEPSNLPSLLPVLVAAYNEAAAGAADGGASLLAGTGAAFPLTPAAVARVTFDNSARFFQLDDASRAAQAAAAAAVSVSSLPAAGGAGDSATAGRGGGGKRKPAAAGGAGGGGGGAEGVEESKSPSLPPRRGATAAAGAGGSPAGVAGSGGSLPPAMTLDAGASTAAVGAGDESDAGGSGGGGAAAGTRVAYKCRLCRAVLFCEEDIMPHDGSGVRSAAGVAGGGRAKAGASESGGMAAPTTAAVATAGGVSEVSVSRWHTAKGREVSLADRGMCLMLLLPDMPWMRTGAHGEGTISCPTPTCGAKLGLYNKAGLKCSCGLHVTPGFKIAKARVDAEVVGADALEAAVAAMSLADRGVVVDAADRDDGSGDDGGDRAKKSRVARTKALAVPVSKHRGNFSEFRNKDT